MARFEDVSPWRSWISSPIAHSTPVEPPAVSYCSSNLTIMDLLAQISGCYSRSTGTKLFFRGFRKDRSQTSLPNHIDPFCSLRAKYVSLDGFGLSPKTPLTVAHTNKCSPLLSFLDFTDQWLNFDFVKSSWLGSGTVMLDVEVSA
ncbi:hypothetical protein YC2023_121635 [Brassica napus]